MAGFAGALATQNVVTTCAELIECDLADDKSLSTLFNRFQAIAGCQMPGAGPSQFWAIMLLAMRDTLVWMGNVGGWHRVTDDVRSIGDGERR